MHRGDRRAGRGALSLALVSALGCTPVPDAPAPAGEPRPDSPVEPGEPGEPGPPPAPTAALAELEAACGELELKPTGPWERSGEVFDRVLDSWHPRAEYGRPVAIRRVDVPQPIPGFDTLEVEVEHAPSARQPCYVPHDAGPDDPYAFECRSLSALVFETPPQSQPRGVASWAALVGTLDQARAVFPSEMALDRCLPGLPAKIRASLPPLGRRTKDGKERLTFVELLEIDDASTMLTTVRVEHEGDGVVVERHELMRSETVSSDDVGVGTPPVRSDRDPVPWPRDPDPELVERQRRAPRTSSLWRTPVSEPCPTVVFGTLSPELTAGDTFDRVSRHLDGLGQTRWNVQPTEVLLLRDHLERPGVRLVVSSSTESGCMMGWAHAHCLVTDAAVYCPDGTTEPLERFVGDHVRSLHELSEAAWFELVAVLTGVERFVFEPTLVGECSDVPGVSARPPQVEVFDDRVEVALTLIEEEGHGVDRTVVVTSAGAVTQHDARRWTQPEDDGNWGLGR